MNKITWTEYYIKLLDVIKLKSPDHIQVGAIIVSIKDNRIISTGFNGIKAGINESNIDWDNREMVSDLIIHAEMNALLY